MKKSHSTHEQPTERTAKKLRFAFSVTIFQHHHHDPEFIHQFYLFFHLFAELLRIVFMYGCASKRKILTEKIVSNKFVENIVCEVRQLQQCQR